MDTQVVAAGPADDFCTTAHSLGRSSGRLRPSDRLSDKETAPMATRVAEPTRTGTRSTDSGRRQLIEVGRAKGRLRIDCALTVGLRERRALRHDHRRRCVVFPVPGGGGSRRTRWSPARRGNRLKSVATAGRDAVRRKGPRDALCPKRSKPTSSSPWQVLTAPRESELPICRTGRSAMSRFRLMRNRGSDSASPARPVRETPSQAMAATPHPPGDDCTDLGSPLAVRSAIGEVGVDARDEVCAAGDPLQEFAQRISFDCR